MIKDLALIICRGRNNSCHLPVKKNYIKEDLKDCVNLKVFVMRKVLFENQTEEKWEMRNL